MDAYWRATNCLSVGQMYPLLSELSGCREVDSGYTLCYYRGISDEPGTASLKDSCRVI